MADRVVAAVAVSRCQSNGDLYALRFEKAHPGAWRADWAFPIKESGARREGYDNTQIQGLIEIAESYPGCPSCSARFVFLCGCGKLTCHDGIKRSGECAWCGSRAELVPMDETAVIQAGIDA